MNDSVTNEVGVATLLKATVSAAVLAAVALVLVILPAEYNIDPTGLGEKFGLTVLAESGSAVSPPAATEIALNDSDGEKRKVSRQTVEVTVPAQKGIEYKVLMQQYDKLSYEWHTDGEPLYFDLHGEPAGDTSGYFESYAVATSDTMQGSFTAPFAGTHGWYWKNTTDTPVNVTLMIGGQFQIMTKAE